MNLIMYIRLLPIIFTAVVSIAKALEDVIPEDGWGNQKLAALDDIMKDAIESAQDIQLNYDIIKPRVHKIAEIIVALMNVTGKFKKAGE